jgi:hypothetical protein
MRATLALLGDIAAELHAEGTYESMNDGIPYGDLKESLEVAAGRGN